MHPARIARIRVNAQKIARPRKSDRVTVIIPLPVLINNTIRFIRSLRAQYLKSWRTNVQSTHISRRSLTLTLAALPVGLIIAAELPTAPPKDKSSAAADGLS